MSSNGKSVVDTKKDTQSGVQQPLITHIEEAPQCASSLEQSGKSPSRSDHLFQRSFLQLTGLQYCLSQSIVIANDYVFWKDVLSALVKQKPFDSDWSRYILKQAIPRTAKRCKIEESKLTTKDKRGRNLVHVKCINEIAAARGVSDKFEVVLGRCLQDLCDQSGQNLQPGLFKSVTAAEVTDDYGSSEHDETAPKIITDDCGQLIPSGCLSLQHAGILTAAAPIFSQLRPQDVPVALCTLRELSHHFVPVVSCNGNMTCRLVEESSRQFEVDYMRQFTTVANMKYFQGILEQAMGRLNVGHYIQAVGRLVMVFGCIFGEEEAVDMVVLWCQSQLCHSGPLMVMYYQRAWSAVETFILSQLESSNSSENQPLEDSCLRQLQKLQELIAVDHRLQQLAFVDKHHESFCWAPDGLLINILASMIKLRQLCVNNVSLASIFFARFVVWSVSFLETVQHLNAQDSMGELIRQSLVGIIDLELSASEQPLFTSLVREINERMQVFSQPDLLTSTWHLLQSHIYRSVVHESDSSYTTESTDSSDINSSKTNAAEINSVSVSPNATTSENNQGEIQEVNHVLKSMKLGSQSTSEK
ncbi:hypothetical protein MP228_001958 [Amoeboaphelidium protococcarum]|nr:hypothetical protein MP228_001958 [Amoeboaphelidium protococcarum]